MTYTYAEALEKVEKFNIETGVREFCSVICQGKCCRDRCTPERSCEGDEGRRFSCSVFVCNTLREIIFTPSQNEIYLKVDRAMREDLEKLGLIKWLFYSVHTKKVKEEFSIKKSIIDELDKISDFDRKVIKKHIEDLMFICGGR